jgi:hypothetical protein
MSVNELINLIDAARELLCQAVDDERVARACQALTTAIVHYDTLLGLPATAGNAKSRTRLRRKRISQLRRLIKSRRKKQS